jgi:MFS transporter, AAHS family, 4-hydroxybenzoate transporter
MLVNFFINSWLALVLTDIGFSGAEAATLTSFYYVGGICGAFLCGMALDRIGPAALAVYALVGALATFLISLPNGSFFLTAVLAAGVGLGVLGAQAGITAMLGLLYPTPIRAKGAGIAHSVGRLGGIAGPLLAGALMAQHTGILTLFLVPAVAIAVAAPCFVVVTGAWTGKLLGRGLAAVEAVPGV